MMPNCRGCKEEFEEACYQVSEGNIIANSIDCPGTENIGCKGHYKILIIDKNANIIMR